MYCLRRYCYLLSWKGTLLGVVPSEAESITSSFEEEVAEDDVPLEDTDSKV